MDNLILRYRHSLALFGYILLVFFIGLSFKLHLNESEKVRTNYIYIMRNSCERDNDTINAIGQVLRDNYYSNIQGYSPTDPRRITSRLSINLWLKQFYTVDCSQLPEDLVKNYDQELIG